MHPVKNTHTAIMTEPALVSVTRTTGTTIRTMGTIILTMGTVIRTMAAAHSVG
jgi:hypothetical protein